MIYANLLILQIDDEGVKKGEKEIKWDVLHHFQGVYRFNSVVVYLFSNFNQLTSSIQRFLTFPRVSFKALNDKSTVLHRISIRESLGEWRYSWNLINILEILLFNLDEDKNPIFILKINSYAPRLRLRGRPTFYPRAPSVTRPS